jgi:predicted aspartyl protease
MKFNGMGLGVVMQLMLRDNLLFVEVTIAYQGISLDIANILVDTGSATTILAADIVASIQILPVDSDNLYTIRGVGGNEFVFARHVDYLKIGERHLSHFEIKIGEVDYGFGINGVLGMDFMLRTGAIINLKHQTIEFFD